VLGRWPYTLARFHSRAFERGLRQIVAAWRPDLAFINNLHMAPYVDALPHSVNVLRQQNLEQLWLERFARETSNPAVAAYGRFQARRMRGAEAGLCRAMALACAWGGVAALWYGAGMRVKTVEAIAAGVPVAATPLGAEGLGLEPGRHYLEGGTARELGEAALALLEQSERTAALAASAHEFLRPSHGRDVVARRTVELCEEALATRAARGA